MSSINTNPNTTSSDVLQLNLNDSALELLNAAIVSHQLKIDDFEQLNTRNNKEKAPPSIQNESTKKALPDKSTINAIHSKRELDKDEQTSTTPKRVGRKPIDNSEIPDVPLDPKQKRKAQNRAAQRAFRDRKEKHLAELQARIEELEALNATKNEDLIKENQQLREQLKRLQEENYALKGAQFTFEFPISGSINKMLTSTLPITNTTMTAGTPSGIPSTPITVSSNNTSSDINYDDLNNLYPMTTSGSSMSSSNSYSGEDNSSSTEQHSPDTNNQTHEDDSTSADTPITSNPLFSPEPIQFGLIQPPMASNALDFLAVTDVTDGIGNGLTTVNNFPTGDLFHGKDDLFTSYTLPANNTNDNFLFTNEDLSALFGANEDLFNFNTNINDNNNNNNNNVSLSLNTQFGLPETPTTRRLNLTSEKKQLLIQQIKKGQEEGKYVHQIHQEIKEKCPDFDLDGLCDDLKKKAQCSSGAYPLTDHEVDAFVKFLSH
ncbi:uncharacterized protein BX663DRAFT_494882 [Cokeromyces recurvatus]|uniref:uncharacterized protein n=1 Tax=Cokeromyces recurvatus TaxID=90255 RepID=UPI002220EEA6|nr:uncharacterized protein BX663DRAFT_494882 [Cokeromyces recurvatus]KAI7907116.1 hypothetical protein BX663DRAFT_494882 [Cokeromyces recurvatus]